MICELSPVGRQTKNDNSSKRKRGKKKKKAKMVGGGGKWINGREKAIEKERIEIFF